MTKDQAKLIKGREKYLKPYAAQVQEKIRAAGTTAALVVVQRDLAGVPAIIPSNDPLATAKTNIDTLNSSDGECVFVFRSDLPLAPEPLSCSLLILQAKKELESDAREDRQEKSLDDLHENLTALNTKVSVLADAVKKDEDAIKASAVSVALLSKVVYFHDVQFKNVEDRFQLLEKSYKKTTEVVSKNNEQIDSMVKDLNTVLNDVKQRLDLLRAKLDTIK